MCRSKKWNAEPRLRTAADNDVAEFGGHGVEFPRGLYTMKRTLMIAAVLLMASLACWPCGRQGSATTDLQSQSAQTSATSVGNLRFKAHDCWVSEKPSSSMDFDEYKLPNAEGEKENA